MNMKKVLFVITLLALVWQIKADCPHEVEDYTFTDCHGVQYDLHELLDGGQYVLIHFVNSTNYGNNTISFVEKYHNYGCNGRDVFFMEVLPQSDDSICLAFEGVNHLEMPVIGINGGGGLFYATYDDCIYYGGNAGYMLLAPDHGIYQDPVDNDNIVGILEGFGVQPFDCNFGNCLAPTNLIITNNGDRMSLSWDGPENALYYHLYWRKLLGVSFDLQYELNENYIDALPYRALDENSYYVVSRCEDGSENKSEIVSLSGNDALDFNLVDCHGNELRVFDILDQGQYIFIDCFFYHCGGCRVVVPYIEEAYHYYGCNEGDVFFMEMTNVDSDIVCQAWEEELGVEYPTISKGGGGWEFMQLYGINIYPNFLLISPDRTIALASMRDNFFVDSFQSIKDAFDMFGIEEQQCNDGLMEEIPDKLMFPNPADAFVNLTVESSRLVRIYNALGQLMDSFIAEDQQIRIDTGNYSEGLYFLQVDGKGFGKFVVRH